MIFINTGSAIAYVNKKCEEVLGYSKEEFYSDDFDFLTLIAPEFRELITRNFNRRWRGEEIGDYEYTLVAKNGKRIEVALSMTGIEYENRKAFMGTATDITERKRVEEESIRSKKTFSLAAKLANLGPWEYDINKGVFIFNDEFYAIYGTNVKREGITMTPEKYVKEFIHPEDAYPVNVDSPIMEALPGLDNINRIEHRIIRRDGEIRDIAVMSRIIKNASGKIIEWYGANQDITESKLAEKALRASEDKYRSLIQNMRLGIFRVALENGGRFTEANKSMEEITGYSRNELLNMTEVDLYSDSDERARFIKQIITTPEKASFEISFKKKSGTQIDVSIIAKAIKDNSDKVLYIDGILEDITEKKKLEERVIDLYHKEKKEREELQEEARTRGMFIDVLAHELRTPLTPILASIGMLNDLLIDKNSVQGRLTANVYRGAEILSNRLEELLEVARYSRGTFKLKKERVETRKYLNSVISRFKPSIDQRGQTLTIEIAHDLPPADIDLSRFEQVLVNLLSNASKFSPQNGHINFRSRVKDDELLVEVQDDGIGISTEESQRIFQPYHRVEQDRLKFPGLGLGLAVAKQIIEAHGGRIWINSELGHGSIFSVMIPIKSRQSN